MIHLLIPREEIDGHMVYHSEAFWQKERDRQGDHVREGKLEEVYEMG